MRPRIISLNISQGGVPKLPIARARITGDGMEGDRQRNLRYHGGPDRALCLWSLELIEALRDEGDPVFPGSAGENVTVSGVDWRQVVPGARLRLGPVLVEVTSYTAPCRTIRASFARSRAGRISQQTHPGWSRVYARVIEEGEVATGDAVSVEELQLSQRRLSALGSRLSALGSRLSATAGRRAWGLEGSCLAETPDPPQPRAESREPLFRAPRVPALL